MHLALSEHVSIFCLLNKKRNPGFLKHRNTRRVRSYVKGVILARITQRQYAITPSN